MAMCRVQRKMDEKISKSNKLIAKGWLEDGEEEYSNIKKKCPKCSRKLKVTDASRLCGIIMVYCSWYKCRYCELFSV